MKPTPSTRSTTLGGTLDTEEFDIDKNSVAHIIGILHTSIYTDPIAAVLREYGANAWDANKLSARAEGRAVAPIRVRVPTHQDPVLRIRDFGPGMSHDFVKKVFTKYGASTKRDSDDAVGMLGIGCKSGYAYADTFTVISIHEGVKRTYVAAMEADADGNDRGTFNLLSEVATDEESGVEVVIAAKREDIGAFQDKARKLYRYYDPRPDINIDLPAPPAEQTVLKNGAISSADKYDYTTREWIAIMGCVPYRVDLSKLDQSKLHKCLPRLSGQLYFDIGGVKFNASREELRYTPATQAALIQKFNDLIDEYVVEALQTLETSTISDWDKRLKVQVLRDLQLPLPEDVLKLADTSATIECAPGTIRILQGDTKAAVTKIHVSASTRLLIDDTTNKLEGYHFAHQDYVVRSDTKDVASIRKMLDAALAAAGLSGVQIVMLSTLYYSAPYVKPKKVANPKHKASMFALAANAIHSLPLSDHWEVVVRVPSDDDVFVVMERFEVGGSAQFYRDFAEDTAIAALVGIKMPTVHGYKTSEKKPLTAADCKGVEYYTWRREFAKSLSTPENAVRAESYFWSHPEGNTHWSWPTAQERVKLAKTLGDDHAIIQLLSEAHKASLLNVNAANTLRALASRIGVTYKKSRAFAVLEDIKKTYPLLDRTGLGNLWDRYDYKQTRDAWIDYVLLVDERAQRQKDRQNTDTCWMLHFSGDAA